MENKEIKPVNPKGNQPQISVEGLMLKLKLQSFGHLMQTVDSQEKTLMLEKIRGQEEKWATEHPLLDGWMALLTQWTSFSKLQEINEQQGRLVACSLWRCKESDQSSD